MADVAARRVGHQFEKTAATHMNQCPVIARLEIDVRRIDQTLVENRVDAVGEPQGWQGTRLAVLEEVDQLAIGHEPKLAIELTTYGTEVHLVARRQHGHEETLVVFQHDAFGQSITGNVSRLGTVVAVLRALVRDQVVEEAGQSLYRVCLNLLPALDIPCNRDHGMSAEPLRVTHGALLKRLALAQPHPLAEYWDRTSGPCRVKAS